MPLPDATEYAPYYAKYVSLVPDAEIVSALATQLEEMRRFLGAIPEAQGNLRHPPYTWSIKEVVGHLTDSERVFGYRALRFARGDATPLPGFDENVYARAAEFDRLPLGDLVAEFEALRRSHVLLFRGLTAAAWSRTGTANGAAITVRALAYILVGHGRHHTAILRKRLASAT
jgi:DinB superfamily